MAGFFLVAMWAGRSPIFKASEMYWRGFPLVLDRDLLLNLPERNSRGEPVGTGMILN